MTIVCLLGDVSVKNHCPIIKEASIRLSDNHSVIFSITCARPIYVDKASDIHPW